MSDPDAALAAGPERSVPEEAPTAKRSSKGRSAAVIICVVLAALLTTPAAIAYWGQRTLNDATRYVNTVGPLVNSPEVQDAIATKVTDTIQKEVDVEALLNQVFSGVITDRPRLQRLVGPLAAAINTFIAGQVREFLASDQFAELWTAANVRAQQSLQRILKGDQSGAVQLQGDQVVLDLSDVIDQVKQRLVDRGLTILQNVPIPNVDKQIVLMDAPQLKQIRTIYAFANPLAQWLIVLVAALYLAALVLARRRPRMTVIIGALLAASLVVIGWFAGSNRYGTAVRGGVTGGLEGIGGALADSPVGGAGRWVAANVRWLRVVVALLGVVVLLWGNNISLSRLFWSLALVVGLLAVLQVMVGAGRAPVASGPVAPPGAVPGTAK